MDRRRGREQAEGLPSLPFPSPALYVGLGVNECALFHLIVHYYCILRLYASLYTSTSNNQFGFKNGSSCAHATLLCVTDC